MEIKRRRGGRRVIREGEKRDEKGTGAGFGERVSGRKGGRGRSYCDEKGGMSRRR